VLGATKSATTKVFGANLKRTYKPIGILNSLMASARRAPNSHTIFLNIGTRGFMRLPLRDEFSNFESAGARCGTLGAEA
jgi:hypothetical protein